MCVLSKCSPGQTTNMCFIILYFPPALILEEIAIDCHNKETEERLLQEAHDLHLSSLQLAKKAFGEFNVQTAKHYGNLGRLYQSMRKFKVGGDVCLSVCPSVSVRTLKMLEDDQPDRLLHDF